MFLFTSVGRMRQFRPRIHLEHEVHVLSYCGTKAEQSTRVHSAGRLLDSANCTLLWFYSDKDL